MKRKRPLVRGHTNHISHVENDTESSSLRTALMYRTSTRQNFAPGIGFPMRIGSSYANRERRYFVQSQRYPNSRGVGEFKNLKLTESLSSNYSVKGVLFNPSIQYLLTPLLCANLKKVDIDLT